MFFSILEALVPNAYFAFLLFLFVAGGFSFGLALRKILLTLARRSPRRRDFMKSPLRRIIAGTLFETVARTSIFLFTGLGVVAFREFSGTHETLTPEESDALARLFRIFIVCAITIFLWHFIRLPLALLRHHASPKNKSAATLIPLISASLKILVIGISCLIIIRIATDTQPAEVLAMLGIGGLAIGLASQDSVKNFFGSVMLIIDRPFQAGDFINADGIAGTVEEIGVRSTRIRATDGSLFCIPNGELANKTIRTVSARKTIRDAFTLGLTYDTPPQKIREAMAILAELLDVPECAREGSRAPRIFFSSFGESSLNIEVIYHFATADSAAFRDFKSRLNLEILSKFAAAEIAFAFPTVTVERAGV